MSELQFLALLGAVLALGGDGITAVAVNPSQRARGYVAMGIGLALLAAAYVTWLV